MGEIRFVGPCKTRGYPYPVCKNTRASTSKLVMTQVDKLCAISLVA